MAILNLNIYRADNKNQIEKTYTAEGYDLMFGTLQDVIAVFDIDKIRDGNETELAKMAVRSFDLIAPILRDVFPDVTPEELRRTKTKELVPLFVAIAKDALGAISSVKKGN